MNTTKTKIDTTGIAGHQHGAGYQLDVTLIQKGTRNRFGVYWCPEGESAKRTVGGQSIPGPWACSFALCTVINVKGGATDIEVDYGDLLIFDDCMYRVSEGPVNNPRRASMVLVFAGVVPPPPPPTPDPTGLRARCVLHRRTIIDKTICGISSDESRQVIAFTDGSFCVFELTPAYYDSYDHEPARISLVMVEPFKHRFVLKAAGIMTTEIMKQVCGIESAKRSRDSDLADEMEYRRLKRKFEEKGKS